MNSFRSSFRFVLTGLFILLASLPLARATNQMVDVPIEKSSGFTNGTFAPFYTCTTLPANAGVATTLNGQPCVKFTWNESVYNGTRTARGTEACSVLEVQKECWFGFYMYLPSPGYPTNKEAGVAQWFANNSACSSWAGMLILRNNDLTISHRGTCGAATNALVYTNFPRNRWVSVVTHVVASGNNAGKFEIFIDGVSRYNAVGINFGFDTWTADDALQSPNNIGLKIGQYAYDDANYDDNEVRTIYYTNVTQVTGNPAGALDYIRLPVAAPSLAPLTPANLNAAGVTSTRIDLSWTPPAGAAEFTIRRATTSGGPYTTVATNVTGASYSDTSLSASTTFHYVIAASNAAGSSADSAQATGSTLAPTAPDAPAKLIAVAGPGRAHVSWPASLGADTYTLKRATTSGGPYLPVTNTALLEFNDSTLTNGTTYYYVVSATNIFGEGTNSAEASVVPAPGGISYWPFNEASGTTATDVWSGANATLGSGAAWMPGAVNNAVRLNGTTSGYVDVPAGIVDGVTDFTVSAWVHLSSAANWSRLFDFGTSDTNYMMLSPRSGATGNGVRYAIRTPSITERQIAGPAIALGKWTHLAVTQTGTTGILYINGVEAGRNTAMTLNPASLGSTTLNKIGVSKFPANPNLPGTVDDFHLYNRALSPTEIYTMVTAVSPARPTNLSATGSPANVLLTWNASSSATTYNVKRSTVSGGPYTTIATGLTTTSYTDTGAIGGVYYYVVTAETGIFESAASDQAVIQLPPSGVVASGWNGRADLSWLAVSGATSYSIKRSATGSDPFVTVGTSTTTSYSDSGLTNGTRFYYAITAITTAGESSLSTVVSTTPTSGPWVDNWTHGDIGTVGATGNGGHAAGLHVVHGAGSDIWSTADSFHYLTTTLTGNGAIVARVMSVQNTHLSAKAGLMMRASLAANSQHASVFLKPDNAVEAVRRPTAGAVSTAQRTADLGPPRWIRLARSGNAFTTSSSADGINWVAVGTSQTITMGATIQVGLAVTSRDTALPSRAEFESVNIATAAPVIGGTLTAAGTYGSAFSYAIQSTNTPYLYAASPLPAGLTVDARTGVISGVPTATGSFIVTLTAANAVGTAAASLTINVVAQPYTAWATARGLTSANNSPDADPDGDGVQNQLEHLLGMNPLVANSSGLPTGTIENGQFVFRFTRDKNADAVFAVEQSTDLVTWAPLATSVESSTSNTETLTAILPLGAAKLFARLTVGNTVPAVPLGYMNQVLPMGATRAFGLLLDDTSATPAGLRAGRINALTGPTLTNNTGGWTGNLANPAAPWAVRFTSGAAAGKMLDVSANTETTLTLGAAPLGSFGVVAGDSFELVSLDTLGTLFGSTTLQGGSSPANADVVQLRSGSAWISFYYDTVVGFWRRTSGTAVNNDNTVVRPGSGLMLLRRGAPVTLTFVGRVLGTAFRTAINNSSTTGTSVGFPTDTTLAGLSLQNLVSSWRCGLSTTSADSIGLHNGSAWIPYVFNGVNWQTSGGANSDAVSIPAGAAILIQRTGNTAGTTDLIRARVY